MTFLPDELQRLHRVFFPESEPAPEWYQRLASLLERHAVDDTQVIAYLHAMSLRANGMPRATDAVNDAVRAQLGTLTNFGSRVTPVVATTASESWLERTIQFYEDLGVSVVFALDAATSDDARRILSARNATRIEVRAERHEGSFAAAIFDKLPTDWILLLGDDELPTPVLLNFVDKAVEHSTDFVWGFPRAHCRYDSETLQYSRFLPFGPLATADLQWRLFARQPGEKERRSARTDAIILSFDWVVRSFDERLARLAAHTLTVDQAASSLASLYLHEAVPEQWHMFMPLPDDGYSRFASRIHRSRE
ncbi:MAG: hypothetical protein ABI625_17975 [bacterium]